VAEIEQHPVERSHGHTVWGVVSRKDSAGLGRGRGKGLYNGITSGASGADRYSLGASSEVGRPALEDPTYDEHPEPSSEAVCGEA
jgi:hypothetical protein